MNIARIIGSHVLKKTIYQARYASCWSCGKSINNLVANLFCSSCNVLQEPEKDMNYFKIMGLKESFDIDESELAKKFKDLQRFLHPDKFVNKGPTEQEISAKFSSLVNEAYKTLLVPLNRGVYLLRLKGEEIPEKTEVDSNFLLKIMDRNEEVEKAETLEQVLFLQQESKETIQELQQEVSEAFSKGDLKKVIKLLGMMKYYTSVDEQIQKSLRKHGYVK